MIGGLVDIHCHLLPGIDDGSHDLDESLAMARIAVSEGIRTIICTPHQLGNYAENRGATIRQSVDALQAELQRHDIPLRVLPGGDVRIDDGLLGGLKCGDVLTLGDHHRHVLLELPHELYFPLQPVLEPLRRAQLVGILSHPERNQGILRDPELVGGLIEAGCLMQITAGSLCGTFGEASQSFAKLMLEKGWVHFVATDAHGDRRRRPLIQQAYTTVCDWIDEPTAEELCRGNPARVAAGQSVAPGRRTTVRPRRNWLGFKKVTA